MRWSQLNIQTTYRPEQYELQRELKKLGIESELEFKVFRPEYRCRNCGKRFESTEPEEYEDCIIEQMYYQFDLHLLKSYEFILIELQGSIHKKKGVMRHDERKRMFAEAKGYTLLEFSSKKRPYKIAEEIVRALA